VLIAAVQAVAFFTAVFFWRRSLGTWGTTAWAVYVVGLLIGAPFLGWTIASLALRQSRKTPWRAWPVSLAMILVMLIGHGLEDDFGAWAPSAAVVLLSLLLGWAAVFAAEGAEQRPPAD
jgi:hypothetical protein